MNRYYEVKAVIKDEDGKLAIKQFVSKSDSDVMASTTVTMLTKSERITGVNEKNWVEVFDDDSKDSFYEIKVEFENLEGKSVSELYLQKADSTKEAESQLLKNIDYKPEVKGVKITKIVALY